MIESQNKNWQLIANRDLFLLKVLNQSEGEESMMLTVDELRDLKDFLNEIDLPDNSLEI